MEQDKESWGGKRAGAGRPSMGRNKVNFYITEDEKHALKSYIDDIRNNKAPVSAMKIKKEYESYLSYAIEKQVGAPDRIQRPEYHQAVALGELIGIASTQTMRKFIDKRREIDEKKINENLDKIK